MNKLLKWAAVAFLVWWVVTLPAQAGHEVQHLAAFASHAAGSVATALSSI